MPEATIRPVCDPDGKTRAIGFVAGDTSGHAHLDVDSSTCDKRHGFGFILHDAEGWVLGRDRRLLKHVYKSDGAELEVVFAGLAWSAPRIAAGSALTVWLDNLSVLTHLLRPEHVIRIERHLTRTPAITVRWVRRHVLPEVDWLAFRARLGKPAHTPEVLSYPSALREAMSPQQLPDPWQSVSKHGGP